MKLWKKARNWWENRSIIPQAAADSSVGQLPITMGKTTDHFGRSNSSIIFGALSLISNAIGRTKIKYLRQYEVIENDDIDFILNVRPNEYTTANKFWQKMAYDTIWHGNAYAYIVRDPFGKPIAIKELNRDQVQVRRAGGLYFYYVTFEDQATQYVPYENILHFKGQRRHDFFGEGVYDVLIETIMQNEENKQIYLDLVRKTAKIAGTLEFPAQTNVTLIKEHLKIIADVLIDNENAILPLQPGTKFNKYEPSMQQLVLLDMFKMTLQEVATALNIPPTMLGEVRGNADIEALYLQFVSMTLEPICAEIVQETGYKMLGREGYKRGERFEFDVDELVIMELFKKAQAYDILIRNSIKSVNAARKDFNEAPVDGGDKVFITKNYGELSELGSNAKGGEQNHDDGDSDSRGEGA